MSAAILNPQDCLKQPFSHMKYPRNHNACPNRPKKPVSNRTRRSPPLNQTTKSPHVAPPLPPKRAAVSSFVPEGPVKKSPMTPINSLVVGQVRILKRGEEIPKKTADPVVNKPDLGRIRPDPIMIPSKIRLTDSKSKSVPFYAGPVTMTSPPPSDVPLPAFFATKKSVSLFQATDATNDIIRMLRLDIA